MDSTFLNKTFSWTIDFISSLRSSQEGGKTQCYSIRDLLCGSSSRHIHQSRFMLVDRSRAAISVGVPVRGISVLSVLDNKYRYHETKTTKLIAHTPQLQLRYFFGAHQMAYPQHQNYATTSMVSYDIITTVTCSMVSYDSSICRRILHDGHHNNNNIHIDGEFRATSDISRHG